MQKIATFHSPFNSKFGIPRQAGVVSDLPGTIVLEKAYRSIDAVRGMEDFDYLWIIWEFSANKKGASSLLVRPPRLGGNKQLGVFATRSPFRPNPLGLSSVRIDHIDYDAPEAPVIHVKGADLMDGTPILDIKPYIPYTDAHPDAKGGFTSTVAWQQLEVVCPDDVRTSLKRIMSDEDIDTLISVLAQDPRPQYHNDPERIYGMPYNGLDIHFSVNEGVLTITGIGSL